MPTYRTKNAGGSSSKKGLKGLKKARNYPKRLPRDPAKLFRWAARGSLQDYEKLRQLARKARHSLPTYIDGEAFSRITEVDRLRMIEEIQASEQHEISAGWFLDGINWLLDKIPWGNWNWMVSAAQSGINSQKGDGLNEVDEQYARLVGATYGSVQDRPFVIDHWRRQVQFDSEYVSVWDNPDGHRLIAVRGTQGTGKDIGEDILVGLTGDSTDVIGSELLQILAATPQGVVVDLAAHSLGTSLALQAYNRPAVYDSIHETYLYNPAYSPLVRGLVDQYEKDVNVRYFINTVDPVSMGGMGHSAPSNVVFRSGPDPISAHKLSQWQGHTAYQDPIYHAPPETRVLAHKAVYQGVKSATDAEYDSDLVHRNAEHLPQRAAEVPTFDFGDVPAFDFGAL